LLTPQNAPAADFALSPARRNTPFGWCCINRNFKVYFIN
jgi:hypothetical protein